MKRIAIIGGGMAGLSLAGALQDHASITVLEKSRGPGGRIATRRDGIYAFDHGAQFFTARSLSFKTFLAPLLAAGVVSRWDAEFAELDRGRILSRRTWDHEHPHYVATPMMNQLGKHLASALEVRLRTQVTGLERVGDGWRVRSADGEVAGAFDWVISTAPAAQSGRLLPESCAFADAMSSARMSGCYALMLGFEEELALSWQAALVRNADISWVSLNTSKPGRSEAFALVAHATNSWADAHMDDDIDSVRAYLTDELCEVIGQDASRATSLNVHRWRYANIGKQDGPKSLLDTDLRLGACGDWCIRGRVEGAFLSAMDLASKLKPLL